MFAGSVVGGAPRGLLAAMKLVVGRHVLLTIGYDMPPEACANTLGAPPFQCAPYVVYWGGDTA